MTVYIDSLFMINFFADSALLFFVQLFTKRNTGCIRIMLGAVFLSLYSLGSVFESVSFLYGIIPKATVCCLTLLFVFGKSGYPKTFAVFWCSALLLGGIMYAISYTESPYDYITSPNNGFGNATPLISIIGCILLYSMLRLMKKMTIRNLSRERMIMDIDVTYLNRRYRLKALIDTGCCLCEPLSGDAVIVADKRIFADIPPINSEITVLTAAGEKSLPLIFPEKTEGENESYRLKNPSPVVLSLNKLSRDGLYNAIINPDATEDILPTANGENILSGINIFKYKNQTSERKINNDTHQKI